MLHILSTINLIILGYYAILLTWHVLTLVFAFWEIKTMDWEVRYQKLDPIMQHSTIGLTIITGAFNEEKRILNCIYSVMKSNYRNVQMIVVNDGSTDNTLPILIEEFELYAIPPAFRQLIKTSPIRNYYQSKRYPNLMIIDKQHGPANNPADGHNAALNATMSPVIMTLDADTVLEPDALSHILFSFLSVPHCIAVGGAIHILNDNKVEQGRLLTRDMSPNIVVAFQCVEYARSFTYGRAGYNLLAGALCYPGAFTLFETNALRKFGGFDEKNFAFDTEITLKFQHQMRKKNYPTSIHFNRNAIAWTTVPDTLRAYWNQRNKWQRGMLFSVFQHMSMFFNLHYGIVGLITFPFYILFEIFAPVVEFIAYVLLILALILGMISWQSLVWYWGLAWAGLMLLTIGAFYLNFATSIHFHYFSDLRRFIWLTTLEMFGFRQLKAACCFWATLQFFTRRLLYRFKLCKLPY